MERQEIEKFFCNYEDGDDFSGLVRIEIVGTDFTYVGYIHGWEEPPHEDYIHFQEEEPEHASGRMPISMIKSISWYQDN